MISLQMVASLVGKGVLTGTIDVSNDVDFQISATATVKKNGESDVTVNSLGTKHKAGFGQRERASPSQPPALPPIPQQYNGIKPYDTLTM